MRLVSYSKDDMKSIGAELTEGVMDLPSTAAHFGIEHRVHGYNFPVVMIDLLKQTDWIDTVKALIENYRQSHSDERPELLRKDELRFMAPIRRPGKIIGLGLNYRDHAKETGESVPEFPSIFAKFSSSVVNPDDDIPIPKVTCKLDWEVELGVVIGRICKEVSVDEALKYVAGYTIINDVSARDLQQGDGQWIRGKSLDGLCPMGPCIVTTDELGDASDLKLQTRINGVIKQDSSTSHLVHNVPQVVSYLSQSFTLEPGDVITTGTPSGVGFVRNPPEYLQDGDEMELYIEGIGYLRNRIVA
ncbi:MAG: fumarylacetoacetate hydrolase family protein [Candidatus Thorarchaeota archaeon]|nr:MAG: fumarylacetoacetate hydrolase family protein [Candidatus Thorarchaeota archaeon]